MADLAGCEGDLVVAMGPARVVAHGATARGRMTRGRKREDTMSSMNAWGWRTHANGDMDWSCHHCGTILGANLHGHLPFLRVALHRSRCGREDAPEYHADIRRIDGRTA